MNRMTLIRRSWSQIQFHHLHILARGGTPQVPSKTHKIYRKSMNIRFSGLSPQSPFASPQTFFDAAPVAPMEGKWRCVRCFTWSIWFLCYRISFWNLMFVLCARECFRMPAKLNLFGKRLISRTLWQFLDFSFVPIEKNKKKTLSPISADQCGSKHIKMAASPSISCVCWSVLAHMDTLAFASSPQNEVFEFPEGENDVHCHANFIWIAE